MLKTILFDLDGTLLPIDTDGFVKQYVKSLAAYMAPHIPPDDLIRHLTTATRAMRSDTNSARTNAAVFAENFFPRLQRREEELMPFFDRFYQELFPQLKAACPGLPGLGREVVRTAVAMGYEIVLATQPVFPAVAIEERMRWAELEGLPWRLITTYENMHATKPDSAYFHEVFQRVGRQADECLMVGNDVGEALATLELGMDTYVVTDYLINHSGEPLPSGRFGTLAEFGKRLQSGSNTV